jgi:hypothetical protein
VGHTQPKTTRREHRHRWARKYTDETRIASCGLVRARRCRFLENSRVACTRVADLLVGSDGNARISKFKTTGARYPCLSTSETFYANYGYLLTRSRCTPSVNYKSTLVTEPCTGLVSLLRIAFFHPYGLSADRCVTPCITNAA